jgi:hypothetical protein
LAIACSKKAEAISPLNIYNYFHGGSSKERLSPSIFYRFAADTRISLVPNCTMVFLGIAEVDSVSRVAKH